MGLTAKGLPYPDPDDSIANTDAAIRELAEALDALLTGGTAAGSDVVHLDAQATAGVPVLFPAGMFADPPVVVCSSRTSTYIATHTTPTVDGCTVFVRHYQGTNATANVTVDWIATPA